MPRFALFGLAVLLAACDYPYGVRRTADLDAAPDFACVRRVVETTPNILEVRVMDDSDYPGARALKYSGSDVQGVLRIYMNSLGPHFEQTLTYWNAAPPQELIDGTRPVMAQIEQRLAEQCGITGLQTRVKETCLAVRCKTPIP